MGILDRLSSNFRRRCEATATERRYLLGKRAFDPLPARVLAADLEAQIRTPTELTDVDPLVKAVLLTNDTWSAAIVAKDPFKILYHPNHGLARQESSIMHELAHILLKHAFVPFDIATGLPKRNLRDEDEATYLGSCLQIPQRGLLWTIQRHMNRQDIMTYFGASEEMTLFRANVLGIMLPPR